VPWRARETGVGELQRDREAHRPATARSWIPLSEGGPEK
jgi:hypothetical protein